MHQKLPLNGVDLALDSHSSAAQLLGEAPDRVCPEAVLHAAPAAAAIAIDVRDSLALDDECGHLPR